MLNEDKLKELLVGRKFISEQDFVLAKQEATAKKRALEEVLVGRDINLGNIIAEEMGYKFASLGDIVISEEIVKIVPEIVARAQKIVIFDKTKEGLKAAMVDPANFEMIDWLERKTGEKIIPFYTTQAELEAVFKYYRKELSRAFADIIDEQVAAAKETGRKENEELMPIIKIFDTIIDYAYQNRASDVHLEPLEESAQVRFRIDGVLHNVLILPKEIHNLLVTRVKVLSAMRIDEHLAAQDGKFAAKSGQEKFDLRVSVVPTPIGETAVIRILSEGARKLTLSALGLLGKDLKRLEKAIAKPYGMILATGPTGCGKTTTLYTILKILKKPEVNICTIEDPVEYDIEAVTQIQVNVKTNLTFANGLRSIVRQDPNIIMVGEIRDAETAGIAINSAMTGHLVLSTMHANTASTNLPRLIDMGIEPFLVASSINLIIAQRLVRKICPKCRESVEIAADYLNDSGLSTSLIDKYFSKKRRIRVYRGHGCKDCVQTGYLGRMGIFEVMEITEEIKKLIMAKADADQIQSAACCNGMITMLEDGIEKVLLGLTSIEEILRVTKN